MTRKYCIPLAIALSSLAFMALYGLWIPLVVQQPISDGSPLILKPGDEVGQTLLAHYPGLTEIALQVMEPQNLVPSDLEFTLAAHGESGDRTLLARDGYELATQGNRVIIRFLPQEDPPPTLFTYYLRNLHTTSLRILKHSQDMYPEGSVLGEEGDLVFQARFRPAPDKALYYLALRLGERKPGILGSPWIYLLLMLAMIAAFSGATNTLLAHLRFFPHRSEGSAGPNRGKLTIDEDTSDNTSR